jgi:hypothetical protein
MTLTLTPSRQGGPRVKKWYAEVEGRSLLLQGATPSAFFNISTNGVSGLTRADGHDHSHERKEDRRCDEPSTRRSGGRIAAVWGRRTRSYGLDVKFVIMEASRFWIGPEK